MRPAFPSIRALVILLATILVLVPVLGTALATPAAAQDALRDLCPDRPGKGTSPCTVDQGHWQLEVDAADGTFQRQSGVTTDTWLIAAPTLKYGVTDRLDLEASVIPYERLRTHDPSGTTTDSGVGDVNLLLKWAPAGNGGDAPFILHEDGLGWIYVPKGLQDGPLPTHFEPIESPVTNALYPRNTNPPVNWFTRSDNPKAPPGDPRFPYVLSTFRLTEHHTAGGMSRWLNHLAELQPEMFAELSPELAAQLGIKHRDPITVVTLRGGIEVRAMVSRRIRPLTIDGRVVHQVFMPFHWGSAGPFPGGSVNDLLELTAEPNISIHEGKVCLCNIVPGPMPRGPKFWDWFKRTARPDAAPNRHPEEPPPGAPSGGRLVPGHGQHGKTHDV